MRHSIPLSEDEWQTIVEALHAVSPTGGGSSTYHLAGKVARISGVGVEWKQVGYYQTIAHEEYVEHHGGNDG